MFASHHPYVAGPTALDGAYALEQVPPGEYEVVAWHGPMRFEMLEGRKEPGGPFFLPTLLDGPVSVLRRVTVPPGGRVRLDLTLTP